VEGVRPADRPKKTLNKLQIKTARYNNYVRTMLQTVVNGSGFFAEIAHQAELRSLFVVYLYSSWQDFNWHRATRRYLSKSWVSF